MFHNVEGMPDQQQENLLDDLEVRSQNHVAEVRDSVRESVMQRVHAAVELRHGNACDRDTVVTTAQTTEVTTTEMSGISAKPVMVGSVFHLQFDRTALDVPPTLAVCDRCTMLSDTSFELRFRFTQPIELAGN